MAHKQILPLEMAKNLAISTPLKIALGEGYDPRVLRGAIAAADAKIARIILIGPINQIEDQLKNMTNYPRDDIEIHDPKSSDHIGEFSQCFYDMRKHKGISILDAKEAVSSNLIYAAMLVHLGYADGTLSGAVETTSDVVRAALWVIGREKGLNTVSSCFMICPPNDRAMIYSDCGLVIDPDSDQLVDITAAASKSCRALLQTEPKIALLSFSTKGSAKHPLATKMIEATEKIRHAHPELAVEGELQFDAAFAPEIGQRKAPNSSIAGHANVMIFPNLDAGNIGYKISQRIGGALAFGPILQGLAKPANDLSRGADAQDITQMIAVTVLQAAAQK